MIVNDGESVMPAMETFAPNLILLDLMLPGIDGYQVCREAVSYTHLTAHAGEKVSIISNTRQHQSVITESIGNSFCFIASCQVIQMCIRDRVEGEAMDSLRGKLPWWF